MKVVFADSHCIVKKITSTHINSVIPRKDEFVCFDSTGTVYRVLDVVHDYDKETIFIRIKLEY